MNGRGFPPVNVVDPCFARFLLEIIPEDFHHEFLPLVLREVNISDVTVADQCLLSKENLLRQRKAQRRGLLPLSYDSTVAPLRNKFQTRRKVTSLPRKQGCISEGA